jgi:hypothetical protein
MVLILIAQAMGSYEDGQALQRDFANIVMFRSSEVIGNNSCVHYFII